MFFHPLRWSSLLKKVKNCLHSHGGLLSLVLGERGSSPSSLPSQAKYPCGCSALLAQALSVSSCNVSVKNACVLEVSVDGMELDSVSHHRQDSETKWYAFMCPFVLKFNSMHGINVRLDRFLSWCHGERKMFVPKLMHHDYYFRTSLWTSRSLRNSFPGHFSSFFKSAAVKVLILKRGSRRLSRTLLPSPVNVSLVK